MKPYGIFTGYSLDNGKHVDGIYSFIFILNINIYIWELKNGIIYNINYVFIFT